MKSGKSAAQRTLKGAEGVPVVKPPLDKSDIELRFDFSLTEPVRRSGLEGLSRGVPAAEKDAFMRALLGYAAPAGSKEFRSQGCCMSLRYAGCVYFCCGSRESHCQDSCELRYCEAR